MDVVARKGDYKGGTGSSDRGQVGWGLGQEVGRMRLGGPRGWLVMGRSIGRM